MEEANILKRCPCKTCLVRSICNFICEMEIDYYNSLSEKEKDIYMNSNLNQELLKKEVANG